MSTTSRSPLESTSHLLPSPSPLLRFILQSLDPCVAPPGLMGFCRQLSFNCPISKCVGVAPALRRSCGGPSHGRSFRGAWAGSTTVAWEGGQGPEQGSWPWDGCRPPFAESAYFLFVMIFGVFSSDFRVIRGKEPPNFF
jgi:hypothetical protein